MMKNNFANTFRLTACCMLIFIAVQSCGKNNKAVSVGDKKFVVTTMEKGKPETASKEQMIFTDSTFDNIQCHEWGFGATKYTASRSGQDFNFEAVMQSEKEGTMSWKGMVMGDYVHGEMTWHKEGQGDIEYTFEGNAGTL